MKANKVLLTFTVLLASVVSCSKKGSSGSSAETSALTIAGSLSLSGDSSSSGQTSAKLTSAKISSNNKLYSSISSFSVSGYKVACATFEDVPKACGGDVNETTGAFSMSCSGFSSVPFGCFVFNTTTFANYPITFNINSGDEQTSVTIAGNLSASIVLDLDAGVASAAATVTQSQVNQIAIDSTKLSNIDGIYSMTSAPYSEVSSKYSIDQLGFFKMVPCLFGGQSGPNGPDFTACAGGTSEAGYNMIGEKMSGGSNIQLVFNTDSNNTPYLSAWDSSVGRLACGEIESGFSWKLDDGANGKPAINFDLSGADQATLKTAIQSSVDSMITNYFPFLQEGSGSSSNFVASCKFAVNLDHNFWNNTPEQVAACQNNTGLVSPEKCFDGFGDAFGALHRYKFKKLWAQYNGTDPILGAVNFSSSIVSSGAAVKYGFFGWDSNANQMAISEIAGVTSANIDDYRVDVGGCVQQPNWSQSSTGPQYETVVAVGEYITRYGPNGEIFKDKCKMSEKRLLYEATDGSLIIGSLKYKNIFIFVDTGSSNFQPANAKVCQVGIDGNDLDTNVDDLNAPSTEIMTYPIDFDNTRIAQEAQSRMNGGNQEQRKGMKLDAIYRLVASSDSGNQTSFFYRDPATGNGGELACSEIKNPSNAATTWAKVDLAMKSVFDPDSLGSLLSCAMIGISSHVYKDVGGVGQGPDLTSEYSDANNNNVPDIIDNLRLNSCLPKFQFTQVCSEDGFCEGKVICSSATAANGGCDKAEPVARFGRMKVEALGGDKFQFFNKEERYENFFDPGSNKSKQCTRSEMMTIKTESALTNAVASGQKVRMALGRVESKVCEGSSSEVMTIPPVFMDFTKQ